jgi:hypothetical protein
MQWAWRGQRGGHFCGDGSGAVLAFRESRRHVAGVIFMEEKVVSRVASCSCGQLTAHVVGEPLRVSICHCLACQRRSGSVFAAQARFAQEQVTVAGQSSEYGLVGDEGSRAVFHFCAHCGATVYFVSDALEQFVSIPVGVFADPQFPAPTVSVYEGRMHGWVVPPPGAEHD